MSWSCSYANCPKQFSKLSLLKLHQNTHTGERPYACTECPKAYFKRTHLLAHAGRVHSPAEKPLCDQCQKRFASESSLLRHQASCQQTYHCPFCPRLFVRAGCYLNHVRKHSGGLVPKSQSGSQSGSQSLATDKLVTDRSTTDTSLVSLAGLSKRAVKPQHFCGECGKHFRLAKNKVAHEQGVHRDKAHQCTQCQKLFAYAHTLRRHARRCSGQVEGEDSGGGSGGGNLPGTVVE